MATKSKGILYLHRDGLDIMCAKMATVSHFPFTPEIIQDLEVIDDEKLHSSLQEFIAKEKIPPSSLLMILGDSVLFSAVNDAPTTAEAQSLADDFLTIVPFEQVLAKHYQSTLVPDKKPAQPTKKSEKTPPEAKQPEKTNTQRVTTLAVNAQLLRSIQKTLEQFGFSITAAVYANAGGIKLTPEAKLTPQQAASLFSRIDSIKPADNFLIQKKPATPKNHLPKNSKIQEKKKSSLPVLLTVFGVLVMILGIVYFTQVNQTEQNQKAQAIQPKPTRLPSPTPTPPLSQDESASASAELMAEYRNLPIRIINTTNIVGQAALLETALNEQGFVNIQLGSNISPSQTRSIIVFNNSIPAPIKSRITDIVKLRYPSATSQTGETAQFDVIITLGENTATPPARRSP